MRVAHQNSAGSFFVATLSGDFLNASGNATTTVVAAGTILIDLGIVATPTEPANTFLMKKVALFTDPTITGYIPLNGTGGDQDKGITVAKFQL